MDTITTAVTWLQQHDGEIYMATSLLGIVAFVVWMAYDVIYDSFEEKLIVAKNRAYNRGYSRGLDEGSDKGYDEGFEDGQILASEPVKKAQAELITLQERLDEALLPPQWQTRSRYQSPIGENPFYTPGPEPKVDDGGYW